MLLQVAPRVWRVEACLRTTLTQQFRRAARGRINFMCNELGLKSVFCLGKVIAEVFVRRYVGFREASYMYFSELHISPSNGKGRLGDFCLFSLWWSLHTNLSVVRTGQDYHNDRSITTKHSALIHPKNCSHHRVLRRLTSICMHLHLPRSTLRTSLRTENIVGRNPRSSLISLVLPL